MTATPEDVAGDGATMHRFDAATAATAEAVMAYALERMRMDPPSLDAPRRWDELHAAVGETVTAGGLGADAALRAFVDVLAPAVVSVDHPRYFAFIPSAPTEASVLFDLVVSASSMYGGSWLESAGAVYAENQALAWLAGLAGLPEGAGGCFVPGGTTGNLSALVAARHTAQERRGGRPRRWTLAASAEAHSSIVAAARVMDVDVVTVPTDERGRLTGEALRRSLDGIDDATADGLFAVVATAGTTNAGIVDDLAGVAQLCGERGLWLHVDGAYGGAGLAAPSVRRLYDGIEAADSFIVDPHKWLFAPFDCCALLYREPALARAAHTQHAAYLDVVNVRGEWNPSDYAIHLSRRARGLPFWFSLAVHGTDAYRDAVEASLSLARVAADAVRARSYLELAVEADLSVVVFRRLGWRQEDYDAWSQRLLDEQVAFVMPTRWRDEPAARLAIVNPRSTVDDVEAVLDSMA